MVNFKNWFQGLRAKLLFMVALPIALMGLIGSVAYYGLTEQGNDLNKVAHERIPITKQIAEFRIQSNAAVRQMWRAYAADPGSNVRRDSIKKAQERIKLYNDNEKAVGELKLLSNTRQAYEDSKPLWHKVLSTLEVARIELEKNSSEADKKAKTIMLETIAEDLNKLVAKHQELDNFATQATDKMVNTADENSRRIKTLVVVTLVLGGIALLIIGLLTASKLASSLMQISTQIRDAGLQVSAASEQLSNASQQLSSGASEGAASLEETVSSIEELSSMVKQNADHANEASTLSQGSAKSANAGETEIEKLTAAMSDIAGNSKKIEEIISVIDSIAFQTNLLALNAAVEAARAGEQGRGFAVVAEAVRELAQKSAVAAKDISTMIKESVIKTENGSTIANQSGTVLREIVDSVKKVAILNGEIAAASNQQSVGITQIGQAMNQLDTVTQTNASAAEEAAASAEELAAQSAALMVNVQELNKIIMGGEGANTSLHQQRHYESHKPVQASAKKSNGMSTKVQQIKPKQQIQKNEVSNVIPFDEDVEPLAQVGTTKGF